MTRPLIGISTYLDEARWGVWRMRAALLPEAYPRLVRESGGIAALLPPDNPELAAEVVARLDAVIIAGGPDVESMRYAEPPHEQTGPPARERDTWELALITAALDTGIPLLGICRGMQLLNVAQGGTLIQHLPDVVGHRGHAEQKAVFGSHPITTVAGTRLSAIMPGETTVPTYHHQAVDKLGRELKPCAHAEDGTVEGLEHEHAPFVLGVQWHPEMGSDLRVVQALVKVAGIRSRGGGGQGGE